MKAKQLAAVLLMGVGAYALLMVVSNIRDLWLIIQVVLQHDTDWPEIIGVIAIVTIPLCILLIIALKFMLSPPAILTERFEGDEMTGEKVQWSSEVVLRIGSSLIGVLILANLIPRLASFSFILVRQIQEDFWGPQNDLLRSGVTLAASTAIGLYMLFGAPHLVRWQMKRLAPPAETTEACEDDSLTDD